jgi:two-component system sensor histidine kinase MtrB
VRGQDELATLGRSFNAMADSIEAQIKELGELSLVQQRFVSDVSHELRTPLTTIRLAAEMLNDRRDEFDPTTARTAELLQTQVHRFDTLLADLLEISRYDAGSVQLETEAISLAHLAEDMVDDMRPLAATHDTELRFVAPGGHTRWISTRAACAASCATSSAMRSSTARDGPSSSQWTAARMRWRSACAIAAWA